VARTKDVCALSAGLFSYRFQGATTDRPNFGNLFLAALKHVYGDFAERRRVRASPSCRFAGAFFPPRFHRSPGAYARYGKRIQGETSISRRRFPAARLNLARAPLALPTSHEAIEEADLVDSDGPGLALHQRDSEFDDSENCAGGGGSREPRWSTLRLMTCARRNTHYTLASTFAAIGTTM